MKFTSTDYMEKFRCLGSECEDTCCKQWSVKIDQTHYAALQELSEQHPKLAAIASQSIVRQPPGQQGDAYARIELDENGYCPFLDNAQMCVIQNLSGFDALGDTCTFYPRVIYRIDDTYEVAGALSCPEVVRGCLSADKHSGLIEVDEQILPREPGNAVVNSIDTDEATPYERPFPIVRQYFIQVASDSTLTCKQKMYILCYSSHRLAEHYHIECGTEAEPLIQSELQRLASKDIRTSLMQHYEQFEDSEKLGLITVQSIFLIRSQHYQDEPLTPYIRDIINSYIIELETDNPFSTEIDGLYRVYHGRKQAIITAARSQIEDYLSRHLQNCLIREWFIRFPDPFSYMLMLCLRHAMLRFLLYSHPSIYRWCVEDEEHDHATLHKVIEELSVEMLFLFSRSIEHDTHFLQNIYSALSTENMMELHTALCLLRGI